MNLAATRGGRRCDRVAAARTGNRIQYRRDIRGIPASDGVAAVCGIAAGVYDQAGARRTLAKPPGGTKAMSLAAPIVTVIVPSAESPPAEV